MLAESMLCASSRNVQTTSAGSRNDGSSSPRSARRARGVIPSSSSRARAEAAARLGPHKQATLPPVPFQVGYAPPRPAAVVTAAYEFAAEHPEVLSYVPCFCGCQRMGHRGNEDCFVRARDINGDVIEWEPHGMECEVCIDVATRAAALYAAGTSLADIRATVEHDWAGRTQEHTPTPPVSSK